MGTKQVVTKTKKNLVEPYPIFVNKRKDSLVKANDFITRNIKEKAKNILGKINLEKYDYEVGEKEQIISKLEEAIKYDNTNENILQKYFIALKKFNKEEILKNNLDKYFFHLSPEIYKNITNENKKNTSIDKLKELFNLFESYNETSKNKIIDYFLTENKEVMDTNLNYNILENKELSLFDIYYQIFSTMKSKIVSIFSSINSSQLTRTRKIINFCGESNQEILENLLNSNKDEMSIPTIFLYYSYNLLNIFKKLKNYLISIKKVINKCLEFKNLESDYYILLFISLEIKYIIEFEELPKYKDEILEYIKKESIISQNNDIDSTIYNLDNISSDSISMLKSIKDYKKKYILLPYLKLEYANTNNYIYYNKEFIQNFNRLISRSKAISSLLYYLYPGYKEIKLFESEFMDNLFQNAIDNCYFYPFFYKKVGAYTLYRNNQLIFFVPNRSKIEEESFDIPMNYYEYLLANLGSFIYIEYNELFGHYLGVLLSKITKINYQRRESGECIELLLFGSRIRFFNIKQLIFILDTNNYNLDFNKFRDNFVDIKNYSPSKECKETLIKLGIDLNEYNLKESSHKAALFGFNESINYENDDIEAPLLEDCIDKFYELNELDTISIIEGCNHIESLLKSLESKKNK